jgi:Ran GTPase-activating protein (RanGAP) involved in mRNA processing and transport
MPSLTHLNLNGCGLGEQHKARELAQPLATLTSMTRLELNFNSIGDVGGRALYPALARLELLSYLDLGYNSLCQNPQDKEATYRELTNALSKLPALTHLNLIRSYTLLEDWELLAPVFSKLTSLTSLDLSFQRIGQTGFRFLIQALRNHPSLTELIAMSVHSDGRLESDPSFYCACEKPKNSTKRPDCTGYHSFVPALALELGWVSHLVLTHNNFGDKCIANFAPKLPKFSKLEKLDLGANYIGVVGCAALASPLSKMATLTELNLWQNCIGDGGSRALASALSQMINVKILNLSRNEIGDDGAGALASVLPGLTNLTDLNVSYNQIGEDGRRALAPALANLTSLMTVSIALGENKICGTGCRELVPALLSLKSQSLISWEIGHGGVKNNCSCNEFQLELDS